MDTYNEIRGHVEECRRCLGKVEEHRDPRATIGAVMTAIDQLAEAVELLCTRAEWQAKIEWRRGRDAALEQAQGEAR